MLGTKRLRDRRPGGRSDAAEKYQTRYMTCSLTLLFSARHLRLQRVNRPPSSHMDPEIQKNKIKDVYFRQQSEAYQHFCSSITAPIESVYFNHKHFSALRLSYPLPRTTSVFLLVHLQTQTRVFELSCNGSHGSIFSQNRE